ncbi:effector binding domain-containing protein [Anaerocolumna sp. AGMB13020]|uniref:effector binding domain-containing protein n=1 Tax=Anaerocolumna sp. AGMB13020 TaxID=3081750 RepID=UPI0029539339|nr:MerR family transcriptional regulator [Anaerocolumna sp. AGMB13020]WOO38016.1 effector binding domain-containing protein [Anaerocolumna sp. AGMB13020]
MELLTISQVSKLFNVSTRTLRYYEQIGLLPSIKKEEYAYRTYDEASISRLEQIIILRKLRIPLKQITEIVKREDALLAIDIFQENLKEINNEISALSTIKKILEVFIEKLGNTITEKKKLDLLGDAEILKVVEALAVTKIKFKEDRPVEDKSVQDNQTVNDLNKANKELNALKDIRIVYLPPLTVAASQYTGKDSEMHSGERIDNFVRESGLLKLKPDARHFGFNNPMPTRDTAYGTPSVGYEVWVSIPEDMEVPEPLVKKQFYGGLYAAHAISMDEFDHWGLLADWVFHNNPDYDSAWGEKRCNLPDAEMDWALEEQLNFFHNVQDSNFNSEKMQLDLLFPIKKKVQQ